MQIQLIHNLGDVVGGREKLMIASLMLHTRRDKGVFTLPEKH